MPKWGFFKKKSKPKPKDYAERVYQFESSRTMYHLLSEVFHRNWPAHVVRIVLNYIHILVHGDELDCIGLLGSGQSSHVYLVRDRITARTYALKRMPKSVLVYYCQQQSILMQKRVLLAIDFPWAARFVSCYQTKSELCLLSEAILGGDFFAHTRKQEFTEVQAKFYVACVASGLACFHSKNIIFRDVKPENLIIDRMGYLKFVDVGFARFLEPGQRTHTLCGTHEYCAPEILEDQGYGYPADWWALGILVFEVMTGSPPFQHENRSRLFRKILSGKFTCPRSFSPALKDFVSKLLCLDPQQRLGAKGILDIKSHRWFRGFDWESLERRSMLPPYVPSIVSREDISNYKMQQEEKEDDEATRKIALGTQVSEHDESIFQYF